MRLIGLCGRSGSGKSSFCEIAREFGIITVDCDALYREMVSRPSPCLAEIEKEFGRSVIENNALNRKKLAEIVFSDPEKLALLNRVTHMHIKERLFELLEALPEASTVVLDAPTLFESGLNEACQLVIAIVASRETELSRIKQRDSITEEQATARLSNQYSVDYIAENSDIIIYNDSSYSQFKADCESVIKELLQ